MQVRTHQNDTVDALCWRHLGKTESVVEATLELNPGHPAVQSLLKLFRQDGGHPKIGEYAEMFYDQALLNAGLPIQNPLAFTRRVSSLMAVEGGSLAK